MCDLQQQQADLEVQLRQTSVTPPHKRRMVWTLFATLLQGVHWVACSIWILLYVVTVSAHAIDMQLQLRFSITVLSSRLQQLLLAHTHTVAACPQCELKFIQVACYALPWACMAHQKDVV